VKLLIAMPALNEGRSIASVIEDVKRVLPAADVLVIDDGSTDNTVENARNAGAQVVSLPFNVGVGGALRAGFVYASRNGYTHLVQVDADGQHNSEQIEILLEAGKRSDVVIGSRFALGRGGFEVSRTRKLAMRWLAFWLTKICGVKLTDVTSGFRLANKKAIDLFASEYPPEYLGDTVESLVIAHRASLKIEEVPVLMNKRLFGTSSQSTGKALWYVLRATLVIFLAVIHRSPKPASSEVSE
jgi:glycosyltransferase involved in cell wall biosynthesis